MSAHFPRRWLLAALFLVLGMPLSALAQNTLNISVFFDSTATYAQDAPWCDPGTNPDTCIPQQGVELCVETTTVCGTSDANGLASIAWDGNVTSLFVCLTDPTHWTIVSGTTDTLAFPGDPDLGDCVRASNLTGADDRAMYVEAVGGIDSIVIADAPDPVIAGSDSGTNNLGYTITVQNGAGETPDVDVLVAVTNPLPAGVTLGTAVVGQGTYDPDTGIWSIGTIAASATAALYIPLNVASSAAVCTDCITVTAEHVRGTVFSDSESTSIDREFDLALSVVDNPDPVLAGSGSGNLTHKFALLNLGGPSDASGVTVDLTPVLPAGVTLDSAVPTIGSFAGTTWTVGDVAPFGGGSLELTLTVDNTASACTDCVEAIGTAAASSGTDTDPANNTDVSNPTSIEVAEGAPTNFLTTIGFTNGYPGEVTVMISCNNGTPLEQDFEISAGTPVDFVVDLLDFVAPDVNCEVTLEAVDDGYVGSFLANGVDTGDSCYFTSEPEAGEAPFNQTLERMNTCEITAEPVSSTFEVEKLWEFEGDDVIGLVAGIDIWCEPASATTGPDYGTVSTFVYAEGDAEFGLSFYPHWNGETTCYAEEGGLDSSVESDQGCLDGTDFVIGDDDKGCTITNTVFFEGIPTLSQYGLALLALLMLGVGFVGLRRFV